MVGRSYYMNSFWNDLTAISDSIMKKVYCIENKKSEEECDDVSMEDIRECIDDGALLHFLEDEDEELVVNELCESFLSQCIACLNNESLPRIADLLGCIGKITSRCLHQLEYEIKQEYSTKKNKQTNLNDDIKSLNDKYFVDDDLTILRMDPTHSEICREICDRLGEDGKFFHVVRLIYIVCHYNYDTNSIPNGIEKYLLKNINEKSIVNWMTTPHDNFVDITYRMKHICNFV